jgi:hypothetical protein
MAQFYAKFYAPNFRKLEKSLQLALARGINEGGDKVRTQVQRALKAQTGVIKYQSITKRISTTRAYPAYNAGAGSMTYQIIAHGKGMPIVEFPVAVTARGVDAKTWGVDHLFKRSFAIKGKGVDGYRARLGDKRYPIRKLRGPSLTKEILQGRTVGVFQDSVMRFVRPAVYKHLLKAMSEPRFLK